MKKQIIETMDLEDFRLLISEILTEVIKNNVKIPPKEDILLPRKEIVIISR